ncbi:MAG: 3-deoxy-D-manno-octulosonic acid transferase [Muribaculaceae bacterium]|nr:3-deoxy-D-manno-octulosonic acid transferase [Muribaculaceae bacterium]
MNPLYNAGIALYGFAARCVARRNPKVARMLRGQDRTLQRIRRQRMAIAPGGFDLWIHSASLGEFEQARPLIDRLLAERPDISILASFFSPSGFEVRRDYHPRVAAVYLPFDTPRAAEAFIEAAAPRMAIFVKYEFWGNYLSELSRRGIPAYLISAIFRPGQIFFKPWGGAFRRILRCFTHIYVQDQASLRLLASIGLGSRVSVAGDTRFDRVAAVRDAGRVIPEVESFLASSPGAPLFIAGSSWPEDEARYVPWLLKRTDVKAIIAPHEFDSARIDALRHSLGPAQTMPFSEFKEIFAADPADPRLPGVRILLMDCFGLLSSLYRYASVAYVGGGFGKSIHNINEAAAYAIPVVFGPRRNKFKEAADLISCGGAFEVDSAASMATALSRLFDDPAARSAAGEAAGKYIRESVGATDKIHSDLFPDLTTSSSVKPTNE